MILEDEAEHTKKHFRDIDECFSLTYGKSIKNAVTGEKSTIKTMNDMVESLPVPKKVALERKKKALAETKKAKEEALAAQKEAEAKHKADWEAANPDKKYKKPLRPRKRTDPAFPDIEPLPTPEPLSVDDQMS